MGARSIRMPDVGEGVAEAEIVEWSVKVGDLVREDQVVAAVMTDKATVEIPTPVAGTVVALGGGIGDVLAVGAELIRIEAPGLPDSPPPPPPKGVAKAAAAEAAAPQQPPPAPAAPVAETSLRRRRPLPRSAAGPRRLSRSAGRRARPARSRSLRPPSARGRARRASTCASCTGAGRRGGSPTTISTPFSPGRPRRRRRRRAGSRTSPSRRSRSSGMRRRIAQNMAESARRVAHFSYVEEVDVTALEELRAALNARATEERPKLTMLPFLMLAVVKAVADFPQVNAHYDDDNEVITRFGAVHLGIATQTPVGLMVPVVRHAETLGLHEAAREMRRVSEAARQGVAQREELSGSTITLTSLGALGGIASTPIVNRPEVAIVGVNRIVVRPAWRDGGFVPRKTMNLSSSFDHRVVDGHDAATFIQRVRALLEAPAALFIEE